MPLDALVSGRIATFAGDRGFGWVEAIGIRGGRVAFATSAVDLESRADPHTRRYELEPGEIAIPGLTDSHLHLVDTALADDLVDLSDAPNLDAGLARLATAGRTMPRGAWLLGAGWDWRRWGGWPTAAELDAVIPDRPAVLWSVDGHALWVNGRAMAVAGIDARTGEPAGGIIRRTPDGAPEGVLLEDACALVLDRVPPPDEAAIRQAVPRLARRLLELGVVALHDPGTFAPGGGLAAVDALIDLADAGALPIRVHAGIRAPGLGAAIERHWRSGQPPADDPRSRLRVGWLKLFADGTLGSGTAALLEPRAGTTDRGILRETPEDLRRLAGAAAHAGIATQVHAIGDAAVRAGLDALEPTAALVPLMPRLEHLQLVDPADLARFAAAGIAASVQPVHLRDDAAVARREWGPRAEAHGYAWRSLLAAGAVVAFGTDAPVVPFDPWPGIALAVTRRDPSWSAGEPAFGPREALDLPTALRAATVAPAIVAREADRGRLVPGARADLVVLPAAAREPEGAAAGLASVRPRLVLLDGEAVVER